MLNASQLCPPSNWNPKPKPAFESERTVLGALLLNSELYIHIKDMICPADFVDEQHQEIYNAMRKLHEKHQTFDIAMVNDCLEYDTPEEKAMLYTLANNCPSTRNIEAHAAIIREKSVGRALYETAQEIKEKEQSQLAPKQLLVSFLEEIAAEISATDIDRDYLTSVLFEINKAVVSTAICIENKDDDAGV